MNYYTENLVRLLTCMPNLENEINQLNKIEVDTKKIWEENKRLYFLYNDAQYQLESRNMEEEAKILLKDIDWKKENLIFVLGIGNRELLKELGKKVGSGSKIIIYEPNVYILKYILEKENLVELLVPGEVVVWWEIHDSNVRKKRAFEILALKWEKFLYNINIVTCPNYYMYMEEFKKLFVEIKDKIFQYYTMLGNSVVDVLQGVQQNVQNIIPCMESNSLSEITNKYKGYPAIIVASGPSLEKNIHYLKQAQGKAVIIACDASLDACKLHGVKPDAIATIERVVETYEYYYKGKNFDKDLVLLAPSLAWPEIYKDFSGKKIVISRDDDGVDGWWYKFFPNVEHINTGMSCATLAYSVAKEAGCNPIILIGQDLAYTNNKKHSDFTHTEMEGENNAEGADGLLVEDVYGKLIPTDSTYNAFRFWYEDNVIRNPETKLIDATEGGAKIQGSTIMSLEEAIQRYCCKKKEKNFHQHLSKIIVTKQDIYEKCTEINGEADKMIRSLYKIKKRVDEHYGTLEKIYDQISDETTEKQLIKMVKKMQKGDEIISYIVEQRDLITFFQQYIAQTVAHVKGLGNELTPKNVLDNVFIQGNLMGALKKTCTALIGEYKKLQKFLLEEKKKTGIKEKNI